MAKARVVRGAPEPPPITSVTLELTPEEAKYLKKLTGLIGGTGRTDSTLYVSDAKSFEYGFRTKNDAIYSALLEV